MYMYLLYPVAGLPQRKVMRVVTEELERWSRLPWRSERMRGRRYLQPGRNSVRISIHVYSCSTDTGLLVSLFIVT